MNFPIECVFMTPTTCHSQFASKTKKTLSKKTWNWKSFYKITLSIWHLGKHALWGVSQDTLWHLRQQVELSWFDTCSHEVRNIVRKSNMLYLLMNYPFLSGICHHLEEVSRQKHEELVLTTNLQFNQEILWITQSTFYMMFFFTFVHTFNL